ncbi:MAG: transposase [Gordonia polyisoprenivorans]|nr:transposase [Gordonia polyisoprenivorans]
MSGKSPYSPRVRDAAVQAVTELSARARSRHQAMELVAQQIGVSVGTIRNWVLATADPDTLLERLPAATAADAARIVADLVDAVADDTPIPATGT